MNYSGIIAVALFLIVSIISFKVYFAFSPKESFNHVHFMVRIAIFGAMSALLYAIPIFNLSLPFMPFFLQLHFDEIPAFIAGFAYGPLAGFCVIAIKTVIKLLFTTTLGVGELTDLILSSIYVCVASFIYQRKRNMKGVWLAFGVSTLLQVVGAMLINVYVMIPFYINLMGFSSDWLLQQMQLAIPAISDITWTYALLAVLPFNLIKDAIVIALTFIIYRSLHVLLRFDKSSPKKKAD